MKILHLASVFPNKASGLSFSVPNLIGAQNKSFKKELAVLYNTKNGFSIKREELEQYNILVLHSFFIPGYLKLLLLLPKKIKVVICPRGAFSKSNNYALKKHLYAGLYFSILKFRGLKYAIHFLTPSEKNRSRFNTANDFVVGNCLSVSEIVIEDIKNHIKKKYESKTIVYIGRFSKHIKGLDILFELLKANKIKVEKNKIKFKFYGPDSVDKQALIHFTEKENLGFVSFYDAVFDEEKEKVYSEAMFHILNSRSEGFPMSVIESTAFYTPQILSVGTNLQDFMKYFGFGIESEKLDIDYLKKLDFETYSQLCLNARAFAEKHDESVIGEETLEMYLR